MKTGDKRKFAVWTVLTVIWMIVIFLFSAQPAEESYETSDLLLAFQQNYADTFFEKLMSFIVRKAAHMAEFGLLALLCMAVLRSGGEFLCKKITRLRQYLLVLLFSSFYAFTDELHQFFVPGRNATFADWLIDSFGVCAVLWILHMYSKSVNNHRTP